MLNLIGFDNFHVSFMFHVSIGFDNSNAYLCNRPATDTVVSYSNDNFFIQMNASCLSLSFHQKRGAIERGWVQNRPFSFEWNALIRTGRHCAMQTMIFSIDSCKCSCSALSAWLDTIMTFQFENVLILFWASKHLFSTYGLSNDRINKVNVN